MLSQDELNAYRAEYDRNQDLYRDVSSYILNECLRYRKTNPKGVRAVFSREPVLKTFLSIQNKIEDKRRNEKLDYSYSELSDLIALTVLCAYRSDVADFIKWMRKSFRALNSDTDALRETEGGHRGYHYIVTVQDHTMRMFPRYRDVKCEIQVKTLLEEAFDAKSHDLTYKPGKREVALAIKDQFRVLSSSLKAIDVQTEFLKDLIFEEERQRELRREACVLAYLGNQETLEVGRNLSIDVNKIGIHDLDIILEKLRWAAQSGITKPLAKFATLCAVKLEDDYLKDEALRFTQNLVDAAPGDVNVLIIRALTNWTMSRFENAIQDVKAALDLASTTGDPNLIILAKSNFVYFVTDYKAVIREDVKEWNDQTHQLAQDLTTGKDPRDADTLGFYWIVYGANREEVENGRRLIEQSRSVRKGGAYEFFFRYHEYIALRRLLKWTE